jgi:FkbM family methyltransferase
MSSHGEGGLDRLVYERFFRRVTAGVFVDVGAAGPELLSMSAYYRELGWRVIAIEPNPNFCGMRRAAGQEVLEYACADYNADGVAFEVFDRSAEGGPRSFESYSSLGLTDEFPAHLDWSGLAKRSELERRSIRVDVRRLDSLLAEHAPELARIDVVSVDVEGGELEVLAGFSLERYRPRALIVENFFNDRAYRRALARRGYRRWTRREQNEVYVPAPFWRRLLTCE